MKLPALHQVVSPPWIYINDPHPGLPNANALAAIIPLTNLIRPPRKANSSLVLDSLDGAINRLETAKSSSSRSAAAAVSIFADNRRDQETESKIQAALHIRTATIRQGRNFVSVNLTESVPDPLSFGLSTTTTTTTTTITTTTTDAADGSSGMWGHNHIHLNITGLTPHQVAEKAFKQIFNLLSVSETLHLIPESEMRVFNPKDCPGYKYCAIQDKKHPPDAKLVYVGLLATKPTITDSNVMRASIVDRTGVLNFHFKHRGPYCDYTWEWLLSIKPGQRHAMPRMPRVKVFTEESQSPVAVAEPSNPFLLKRTLTLTLMLVPFRATGKVIQGTGSAMVKVGTTIKTIGRSSTETDTDTGAGAGTDSAGAEWEWVPQADAKLVDGKYVKIKKENETKNRNSVVSGGRVRNALRIKTSVATRSIKIFDKNGCILWDKDDKERAKTEEENKEDKNKKEEKKEDKVDWDACTEKGSLLDEDEKPDPLG